MSRLILVLGLLITGLWVVLRLGWLPAALVPLASYLVGTACSLAVPLAVVILVYAPGLLQDLTSPVRIRWNRWFARRYELADLQDKIERLNKAHHLLELGSLLLRQGKHQQARPWFERALEREPDSLDARYRLALCHYAAQDFARAAQLLEEVHARKPDHDYGLAYLRLAQSHHALGGDQRAEEVYTEMLRFYPGHPEGLYHYAMLQAGRGEIERARHLLSELLASLRRSPPFQRRRNRHWGLKARWRLWRMPGPR